jgi:hydrogenase maturation protease
MTPVLVAGVGNIFFGDDAFGCEVARLLAAQTLPAGVRVRDFGIRGLDLSYALLDGVERLLIVDAMPRGRTPGTLYVLEPEPSAATPSLEAHGLHPEQILATARALGAELPRVRVLGCEPAELGSELDPRAELSPPVQEAVPRAVQLALSLIAESWS